MLDKALSVILVVAIIAAIVAIICIIANPPAGERFTEFYILGTGGKAEAYPKNLSMGEEGRVIVGIINQEHERMGYEVEISIDGEAVSLLEPVYLVHGKKWEQVVGFAAQKPGKNQEVEFRLFKVRMLGNGNGNNTSLTLWLGRESLNARVLNMGTAEAEYQMDVTMMGNVTQEVQTKSLGPRALGTGAEWDTALDYVNAANQTQKAEMTLYRDDLVIYHEKTNGDYPDLHLWINVQ